MLPRREMPLLDKYLSQAKSEVIFLGPALDTVTRQHKDAIERLLKQGVHITFLVLNPSFPLLSEVEGVFGVPNLVDAIIASLGILHRIKVELSDAERSRLEIRMYTLMPLHSLVCLDPRTSDATIIAEHYLYNTEPQSRPCHVVTKKKQAELFEKYWNSYLFILERSEEIPFKDVRPQPIKDLLLRLTEFHRGWHEKWRKRVESAMLRSPENGEITWYAVEVKRIVSQIEAEAVSINPELKAQIKGFADEAVVFGEKIYSIFPDQGVSIAAYVEAIKQRLLQQGDALIDKLDDLIPQVKEVSLPST